MPQDKISLRGLIAERGLRKDKIAEDLSIVPSALSHKLNGRRSFTENEIHLLSLILGVHERIVRRAAESIRT